MEEKSRFVPKENLSTFNVSRDRTISKDRTASKHESKKSLGYISLAISSESESSDENEQVSFETNEGENDVKSRSTITEESKEGRVLRFDFWV